MKLVIAFENTSLSIKQNKEAIRTATDVLAANLTKTHFTSYHSLLFPIFSFVCHTSKIHNQHYLQSYSNKQNHRSETAIDLISTIFRLCSTTKIICFYFDYCMVNSMSYISLAERLIQVTIKCFFEFLKRREIFSLC